MKWGGGAFVKIWKMRVFFKVENGGAFVKKVENRVFLNKKVDLSSTQGALCTVSVFFILHFTYFLGGGCVRTQRTPLPTGLSFYC